MEFPEWTLRAQPLAEMTLDVGFVVSGGFYFGPAEITSVAQWESQTEPLYAPAIPRHGHYALSASVATRLEELIAYYRDATRLRDKYKKLWNRQPTYFWLRPVLTSGSFEISFPWYDTWEEASALFAALESTIDGEIFDDMDQGWRVTLVASGNRLYLLQSDFDSGEEQACGQCDRDLLRAQVAPVRQRVERLLADLRQALGKDYWSTRTACVE
jgi:hypothetical protein